MKLGFLGWVPENAKFPFTKWATIASEAGIEFEYIRTRPSNFTGSEIERRNFVDKALQLLEEADAFIAPAEFLEKVSLPKGWTVRELACAAVQYNENKGAVLAIAGDLFSDPGFDLGGRRYPGIEKNEQLARNVLDFLFTNETSAGPRALVERIESTWRISSREHLMSSAKTGGLITSRKTSKGNAPGNGNEREIGTRRSPTWV